MNTKLQSITDTVGRPILFFITAGQVSDYAGAAALMNGLPEADWLIADRGYDADWLGEALIDKVTKPCILGRKSRKKALKYPFRDIAAQYPAGQWTISATGDTTASKECFGVSRSGGGRNTL